jgi:acetate kinase
VDKHKNLHSVDYGGEIHESNANIAVLVIPTDEELAIALQAFSVCQNGVIV